MKTALVIGIGVLLGIVIPYQLWQWQWWAWDVGLSTAIVFYGIACKEAA